MSDFLSVTLSRRLFSSGTVLFCAVALLLSSCVTMGRYRALKDQVLELEDRAASSVERVATMETRLDHLKGLTDKEVGEIRTKLADLAADYGELQMTLGMLQGRQEEVLFKLGKIGQHLTGLKGLVEDRFGVDADALPKTLPADVEELYALGMQAYDQALMRKARAIFKHLVQKFPQHDRTDDAEFMVGESLFNEGRFTEAINSYKTVYDQYQTGDKYQEAVLRIGLCYVRSNKCSKAQKIYKFASRTFKDTPAGEQAEKELKQVSEACK